jgi:hypothetical protein
MKRYEKEQDDIKHLKEFISSCGTYSNLVKQAQSKQKIIDKMVEAGLTRKPVPDPVFRFTFPSSEKIPPPVLAFQNVSFAYSGKKEDYLYTNLEFGIDCDSRIALVSNGGCPLCYPLYPMLPSNLWHLDFPLAPPFPCFLVFSVVSRLRCPPSSRPAGGIGISTPPPVSAGESNILPPLQYLQVRQISHPPPASACGPDI